MENSRISNAGVTDDVVAIACDLLMLVWDNDPCIPAGLLNTISEPYKWIAISPGFHGNDHDYTLNCDELLAVVSHIAQACKVKSSIRNQPVIGHLQIQLIADEFMKYSSSRQMGQLITAYSTPLDVMLAARFDEDTSLYKTLLDGAPTPVPLMARTLSLLEHKLERVGGELKVRRADEVRENVT